MDSNKDKVIKLRNKNLTYQSIGDELGEKLGTKVFAIPAWLAIVIARSIVGDERQQEVIRLVLIERLN